MSDSHRGRSREEWTSKNADGSPASDSLKIGCLQRIADATELMAKNHDQLVRDRDQYKHRMTEEIAACQRLLKSNAALRGYIKRMKREAE